MKKIQVGQNVSLVLETGEKYTKKIVDKEERTKLLSALEELKTKFETSGNQKLRQVLLKKAIELFTVNIVAVEKEKEKEIVIKKAIDKKIKKLTKETTVVKLPSAEALELLLLNTSKILEKLEELLNTNNEAIAVKQTETPSRGEY